MKGKPKYVSFLFHPLRRQYWKGFHDGHRLAWEVREKWCERCKTEKPCPDCGGTGKSEQHDRCVPPNYYTCERCDGEGVIYEPEN